MMKMRLMLFTGVLLAVAAQVFAFSSNSLCLDTRTSFGGLIATGVEQVGEPEGAQVSNWDTTTLEDGWTSLDAGSISKSVCVLNETALVHGGRLTEDETWAADVIHVIRGNVVVPSGKTLTLASGAVVKFTEGAQIAAEGSGEVFLLGAQCADIADDTVGGDTNFDAEGSSPTTDFANWFGDGVSPLSVSFISQDNDQFPTCYYSSGITIGALPVPIRDGYTFLGWFTAAEGGTRVTADTVVTGNMTLYAQWDEEGSGDGGEEYTPASLFKYEVQNGGVIIKKYIGEDAVVNIPPFIDGAPIVSIGDFAFSGCSGLTSVTIPNSVTSIGDWAFSCCYKLVEVINKSSLSISKGSFSYGAVAYYALDVHSGESKIVNYNDYLFYTFKGVINYLLGYVGTATALTLPNNYKGENYEIYNFAFSDCDGLTSVTIPNSVTSIGNWAFSGCSGLTQFIVDSNNTSYKSVNGLLLSKDGKTLIAGINGDVVIPQGVTSIEYYAFEGCGGLTSVTIPDSVTSIGGSAFYCCYYLKSAIFLGDAPRNVGDYIFADCADDFTIKVKKGTKGWNGDYNSTALPTTWHGYPIAYATESELNLTYKVAFNANGGSGTMAVQTIACNTWAKLSANAFNRTGYTFQGWAKSKTGAVAYKNAASVKNLASSGTVTLYAIWKPNTYKVAFNANGGSGTMSAQTMGYDTWTKLRANAFNRTGYTFQGWAKSRTGTVAYKNGVSVKNLASSGTVTLYAIWKPNTYKVAFNANGGKGKMSANSMTYGKTAKLRANAFKRLGYVFIGWAKSKTGAVAYKNAASVKNLRSSGTITLYAVWAKKNYKVAFYANGGKGKMSAQTFTYGKAAKLKKNTFKRTGYVFIGWAKSAALAKKGTVSYKNAQAIKNLTTKGSTIKLYAVWAKTKYKVAFYANGGKGKMSTQTFTYGKAAKLKKNAFKRTGYAFKGWAKSSALAKKGTVSYKNTQAIKNLVKNGKTVKLYAVWKRK